MSLDGYETAYAELLAAVSGISNDLDDLLVANALRRYDRGSVIAAFVDRYAAHGDATVTRLAADRGLHPSTLYEDIQVYRAVPDHDAFKALLASLRSWSRITRSLKEIGPPPAKTMPEAAAYVDRSCYVLEETGRLIERLRLEPPDTAYRQETAGTLYQVGRDAIETALTLDPSLALPDPEQFSVGDASPGFSPPDEISPDPNRNEWVPQPNLAMLLKIPHHKERLDGLYPQLVDMLWMARRTGAYMAANWIQDGLEGLTEEG